MNILLVSQCSKRALVNTRRILDQFAERKGKRTWATAITQDGLDTLQRLLRKSARRNTAVACHWLKSSGPELCWVVGNPQHFNEQGTVPTNTTKRNVLRSQDENRWQSGAAISLFAGIAGLFHDFGKANRLFQDKLLGKRNLLSEPVRHEWISLRLFQAFVNRRSDKEWLTELSTITPGEDKKVLGLVDDLLEQQTNQLGCNNPFEHFDPIARSIGWLIVSHHRLPQFDASDTSRSEKPPTLERMLLSSQHFDTSWNSPQCRYGTWKKEDWQQIRNFPYGTPLSSKTWCTKANRFALRALQCHTIMSSTDKDWLSDRFTSHLARLSLMLADHTYSAGPSTEKWRDRDYQAFANTDGKTRAPKQALDEHNVGVGHNAYLLARNLPRLRHHLPKIVRHKGFQQRSKDKTFRWQDDAFDLARSIAKQSQQQGFFGINMASTGGGKTLANARIMYGLSDEKLGCRFSVALGLRTLTLQTGDALAKRLSLRSDELAVLIGSTAVQQLHEMRTREEQITEESKRGSESAEPLFDTTMHVRYEGILDDGPLRRWIPQSSELHKFISAPVLVSTIDHLILATEGTRGGKQIAPMLRLLTADLVLDEPDDFGLADLPALCRLVHWAGVLGSRVLLSSATLPPALLNALFEAYRTGRVHYHQSCGEPGEMPPICCAWFDEFDVTQWEPVDKKKFKEKHNDFVTKRLSNLQKKPSLRHGAILPVSTTSNRTDDVVQSMATAIRHGIFALHEQHHEIHSSSGKRISIGLVRMANINPLVAVAQQVLMQTPQPDTRIHFCIYHSHHPLLVRSAMEKQLDTVLKRHTGTDFWQHGTIQQALSQPETNQIFVVFASPVAEIGRDHDYDWAIAEPSSMRSLIQLAGRIQRHRERQPASSNMWILDRNVRALLGKSPAYCKPGFESEKFKLANHDMTTSLLVEQYQWIGSAPAIQMPPDMKDVRSYSNLVELEHAHLAVSLFSNKNTLPAVDWWRNTKKPEERCIGDWSWAGEMQRQTRFRASQPDECFVLYQPEEDDPLRFHRLETTGNLVEVEQSCFERKKFVPAARIVPWLNNDATSLLEALAQQMEWDIARLSRTFTEIRLPCGSKNSVLWQYDPLFGVYKVLN